MILFCSSCSHEEFLLRSGDLLFQVNKESDMSDAITASTRNEETLSFTHVAIVSVEPGGVYALEATTEKGVTKTPLAEFLDASATIAGKPAVVVARMQMADAEKIAEQAVAKACTFLGQPYDHSFLPDNGKMYCSELVWECYRDPASNAPLFTSRPMNFRSADGTMPRFWEEHFATLGESIPEGVQGTNPNDLLREKRLKVVHRYYR